MCMGAWCGEALCTPTGTVVWVWQLPTAQSGWAVAAVPCETSSSPTHPPFPQGIGARKLSTLLSIAV